jgi:hypothetical protein
MNIELDRRPILQDLGDGLVLCRSRVEDSAPLGEFNSRIHSDDGFDHPDERVAAWTRDLLSGSHPTFDPADFTLVVESASGRIISAMNLISQTWTYEGIPFKVGRPELVGTLPEFRNRGLVRRQFEQVHKWSAERGELLQAITGIPYYYRLFGYEMGLELGGGRVGFETQLPKLADGETEPFNVRPAGLADIPFLVEVYAHACRRHLFAAVWTEAQWHYELQGKSPTNVDRLEFRILERLGSGEPVGYFSHPWYDWDAGLIANNFELKPGVSWLETSHAVARYLWQTGEAIAAIHGKPARRTNYAFWLGSEHPCYDLLRGRLPRRRDPYAWYVRIPDLQAFLKVIAPALEHHIAGSPIVGFSGETFISFYRSGLHLKLKNGKLTGIEAWQPTHEQQGNATFPELTFLQLLCGYRSFEELEQSYADCAYNNDETRVLLNTLFPRTVSSLMPVS